MLKILLSGAGGAMGKNVYAAAQNMENCEVVAGVDSKPTPADFPVYKDFSSVKETADVVIDFSNVSNLENLLSYCLKNKCPAVIATTGFSEKQLDDIKLAAREIPIFKTANFSLGVNVLCALAKRATKMLYGFDIEIIEKHHHNKVDAPSGTALMLAEAVNEAADNTLHYEFDRHSKRAKREKTEIGIHSIRGGSIVGEHDVLFAGEGEVITLSHNAESRSVFAVGALKAAEFIVNCKPGLYNMDDLLKL